MLLMADVLARIILISDKKKEISEKKPIKSINGAEMHMFCPP